MSVYKQLPPRKVKIDNPKYQWLEKCYPGFLHVIFMQGIHAGVYESHKLYPFAFKSGYSINYTNKDGEETMDWFWDARELDRVRNLFIAKSKKDLKFFLRVYRRFEKDNRENVRAYQQAEKVNFQKLNDKQLYAWYEKLYHKNIRQGGSGYLADCCLSAGTEDWLTEFIKERLGERKDIKEIVITLTGSAIPTFVNEEEIALYKIKESTTASGRGPAEAGKIKGEFKNYQAFFAYLKANKKLWALLDDHTAKFYWLENNYFAKVLSPEYFVKKLFVLISNNTSHNNPLVVMRNNRAKKLALLKRLDDPWLANVIRFSELATHMQDYRKMALVRFSHFLHLIFPEMARRSGLKEIDYHNLVEPEIKDVFLRHKIDKKKIAERIKRNFVYGDWNGFAIYEEANLKKYVDESAFIPKQAAVEEIHGAPASPGLVRGRVHIVKDAHKTNFKQGEILVTNNTTPEFVPLMKLALAVITEQGGITTHAAIVSRELGVPCVIGTKIATKVLQDGDLVEVDANKGIVRIIK